MGLTLSAWALFALTSMLIELTPGPNMAYLAIVGVSQGRKAGYAAVAGVALGLAIIGIAAALGLAAAINASPMLYQVLRWGGVIYLLWLAFDGWREASEEIEHAPLGSSNALYFRRGLITNLLNPKAAVFYIAVLPGFVEPTGVVMTQTLLLSATYVAAATGIHFAIVTGAAALRPLLEDPRRSMIVRRGLSVALGLGRGMVRVENQRLITQGLPFINGHKFCASGIAQVLWFGRGHLFGRGGCGWLRG